MVRLFTDPRMLDHVPAPRHPERPERLQAILRHLQRVGLTQACRAGTVRPATDAELLRVHTPGYLQLLEELNAECGDRVLQIEADTWFSPGSLLGARLAAGAAVEAVDAVMTTNDRRAFCAIRPPGHHARPGEAMGFCLFGSVAVAASHALETHALERVLIVDWDVHHGNGTQEMFDADPRVGFLSVHRYPFYPGTGRADETGIGDALGTKRNVPLPYGTSQPAYRDAFRSAVENLAARIRPELVLISAGFDAHAEDPVGDLGLDVEDFVTLTRDVLDVAEVHAGGRVVSLLEGGYNTSILAGCVAAHLEALGVEPSFGHRE